MRRLSAFIALCAPLLAAQQPPQQPRLTAQLHYATGGDAWFTTNKDAFVAVFDISRTSVSQIYPTFSAQGAEPTLRDRRVDLRVSRLPPSAYSGGSSLVSLLALPAGGNAWPHTLVMIASTSPLRVGTALATNVALNHALVQEHHFTDVDSDAGINAILELVRPQDLGAEIAMDRIAALPANTLHYTSLAATDPNKVAAGYSCDYGNNKQFISAVPVGGAMCVAVRTLPYPRTSGDDPKAATSAGTEVAATTPVVSRSDTSHALNGEKRKFDENRKISDPAEIKAFIESMKKSGVISGVSHEDHRGSFLTSGTSDFSSSHDDTRSPTDIARAIQNAGAQNRPVTIPTQAAVVAPPSNIAIAPDKKPDLRD